MVFFNDPVLCPDHPGQAVRMAVAMRERVGALARTWRKRGHQLDFGVGIALGYATMGQIGFEGRFNYAAIGTVANLASRLCDEARGGQILVSQGVYAAFRGRSGKGPVEEGRAALVAGSGPPVVRSATARAGSVPAADPAPAPARPGSSA